MPHFFLPVIGDYGPEGYFHKFNGVQNISSMALTLSGTPSYNLASSILHGGFTYHFNDLFDKEDRRTAAGCDDNLPTINERYMFVSGKSQGKSSFDHFFFFLTAIVFPPLTLLFSKGPALI